MPTCSNPKQLVLIAGQTQKYAMKSYKNIDGKYPNKLCQRWEVTTDKDQVRGTRTNSVSVGRSPLTRIR